MNIQLTDIGRYLCLDSKQFGSLRYLYFFLPSKVAQYGRQLCCPVVAAPELQSGERMYLWRVDTDSPGLEEQARDSRHNTFFEQQLLFQIKGNRVESTRLALMLKDARINVVMEDYNGERLLMKNAKLLAKREISRQRSGYKGWTFTLRSRSRLPLAHIKDISLLGAIDCTDFYSNITIPNPPTVESLGVLTDDTPTAISDDFGTLINDDF